MKSLAEVADPDKISLAVHEAGHAVVAILTGIAVRYATIAPRDGGGLVVLRPRRSGFPAQESIAILCAGLIAQDVVGTDDRWDIAEASQAGDVTDIRAAARAWHAASDGVTVLDLAARSWAMAFDLVIDNYGAVLAVAEHLLSSRNALSGPEIRACINGTPTVRPKSVPPDGRTFWIPSYSGLRNWGPAAHRKRKAALATGSYSFEVGDARMSPADVALTLATFGTVWAVLAAGHNLADHVLGQTDRQAADKGAPSAEAVANGASRRSGWGACLSHVALYHLVLAVLVAIAWLALPLQVTWLGLLAGFSWSAVTHAFLDRRWPVR